MKTEWYSNEEDEDFIKCPYCGAEYEPSYEDTYIGGEPVNCYTEDYQEFVCDSCKKKFTLCGYQAGWKYMTETIDGQMSNDEWEANYDV